MLMILHLQQIQMMAYRDFFTNFHLSLLKFNIRIAIHKKNPDYNLYPANWKWMAGWQNKLYNITPLVQIFPVEEIWPSKNKTQTQELAGYFNDIFWRKNIRKETKLKIYKETLRLIMTYCNALETRVET